MSSGGKSGAGQKSLNYYGTFAVAFAWRFDWLTALISNGNYIWQCGFGGPLDLTAPGALTADGYVDMTGSILDPTFFMEGGYLRLYPGVAYANPDPALPGHPSYRDQAYAVACHMFVGQDSGTAPNLQAIGGAKPIVPTTIVAAEDNIVDDRQINPIAWLAEYLLDERGKGLPEALFHTASWLASGHWCAQDAAHRAYSFCSPLFTDQVALRDVVKAVLDPINGFLRWTPDGKLGCYIYEWGTDPGTLITLDERHFTNGRRPKFDHASWEDMPTEIVVNFTDRAYEFQSNAVRVPNSRASQIRQVDDPVNLDRKHVTRAAQAFSNGLEAKRRLGAGTGKCSVRGPIVDALQPGDKVKVNVAPEPGGVALAQLARIDKVTIDRTDTAQLELTLDTLAQATPYTPTWISPLPETLFAGAVESAPSLVHFLAIPLPFEFSGWPPAVGFLATRPSFEVIGFRAYFSDSLAHAFSELGHQAGFAARCQLVTAVGSGAAVLRLQLLDGAAGPDAYIAGDTPGGNLSEANDDTLLAILVTLDGGGRVQLSGGQPVMEWCSIVQRSAVTADTHDYTVLRARQGTAAAAWGAGAAVWVIRKDSLTMWTHILFASMFAATAYFRLASYTSSALDETTPLPETDLVFPSIPAPNGLTATAGTGKAVSLNWGGSTIFSDSGEYAVYRATGPSFAVWGKIGEVRATRFVDHEVTLGTSYQYKIAAVAENELISDYSNTVTLAVAAVLDSEIDQTPPNDPGAATKVGGGTYVAGDGSIHSYLMIRVPALPGAGGGKLKAVEQDVFYRIAGTGAGGWTLQDQPTNQAGTEDIRLDDLPPGSSIEVATIAYSEFGTPSAMIAATGSPFTAPVKTALPTSPTGITYTSGSSANYGRPPLYVGGVLLFSVRVNWDISTDKDFSRYEWAIAPFGSPQSSIDAIWNASKQDTTGTEAIVSTMVTGLNDIFCVRAVDTTGNKSAWATGASLSSSWGYPNGNMSEQNSSDVNMSAVKTGASGASSIRQVVARAPFDNVPTLVGGSGEESVNVDLTGMGFSTKPDETTGMINVSSDKDIKCRYDWDDPSNSSTNAVLKVSRYDGAALTAGAVRLQGEFVEHF